MLVQEHTVEQCGSGTPLDRPHLPHRLVARNSRGQVAAIAAVVKTQGSDTKLVAQMQPYFEAQGMGRFEMNGKSVPPLVTQIADGENGGVMMNEFPPKFIEIMGEASGSDTPPVNVTEYLEYLESTGVGEDDFNPVQPVMQQRIWDRMPADGGPEALAAAIEECERAEEPFHMEGGSWTNDISWVRGYDEVLPPGVSSPRSSTPG